MPASPLLCHVYREHLEHFGEPDDSIVFDNPPPPDDTFPARVEVLIWHPAEDCDVTTFATIGLADRPMEGVTHRAELHFGIRAHLAPEEHRRVARFMANVAMYPFYHHTHFDWWHRMRAPGAIPQFPSCSTLFFHPKFVSEGWDTIEFGDFEIRLLNLIPTMQAEYELGSVDVMLDYLAEREVDLLLPR
jgi:hypothetical protein